MIASCFANSFFTKSFISFSPFGISKEIIYISSRIISMAVGRGSVEI